MTPLRQRMINDMTVRGLAHSTMAAYLRSVTRLARHYRRSPDQISAPEVQAYLLFLHQNYGLSWATCNTIRHGMRFFFRITLGRPDPHFYVPGARVPTVLPQVLNRDELVRLFTVTTNLKHRAVLMTAYAAGLRASELGRLQLSDIDSARMCLRVDQGKGNKDRYVSPSRPGCWSCCASTGVVTGPSTGCSPLTPRPPDDPADTHTHLPGRQGQGPHPQERRDPYLEAHLRDLPARGRRGAARHPTPARAQLHPLDHALPALGPGQHLRYPVPSGPAGVPR